LIVIFHIFVTLNSSSTPTMYRDCWLVGWCLTAISAQKGYIVPCEK